jgi:hypothetical protein
VAALATVVAVAACLSPARRAGRAFCEELARFVSAPSRTTRSVTLWTQWIDLTEACRHDEGDETGERFCDWLLSHTSAEYMEATISTALACVRGQKIAVSTAANTGVRSWQGRLRVFEPAVAADAEIELAWRLNAGDRCPDALRISATPERASREPRSLADLGLPGECAADHDE